jgi:hypothetical protein
MGRTGIGYSIELGKLLQRIALLEMELLQRENAIGTEGGNLLGDAVKKNRRLKKLVWQSNSAGKGREGEDEED